VSKEHEHVSLEVIIIGLVSIGAARILEGDLIGLILIFLGVGLDWIKHKKVPWK